MTVTGIGTGTVTDLTKRGSIMHWARGRGKGRCLPPPDDGGSWLGWRWGWRRVLLHSQRRRMLVVVGRGGEPKTLIEKHQDQG